MSRDAVIESWLASMSESELIDQCFFWHDTALEYGRMYNAVKAENEKLRELVRDMYLCSDETCTDCEHHDYSGEGFWCKRGIGWKKARMRELGIEVDE